MLFVHPLKRAARSFAVRTRAALVAGLLVAVMAASSLAAEPDQRFADLVDAGEFGLARMMIDGMDNDAARDTHLGRLATAQARIGSRSAAAESASHISDEASRFGAFGEVGGMPLGTGGGPIADFDSLIELITTTIAPTTWDEVGGPGSVSGFEGGVYVDAAGLMDRVTLEGSEASLVSIRHAAAISNGNREVHKPSRLRKVSLNRLEREVAQRAALGHDPTEAMRSLAGIYEIKYVMVYPDTGDVVIAGPAGPWRTTKEGFRVNVESGKPVLHLDDLVVCLRNAATEDSRFGCSITPRKDRLAATKAFLQESSEKPLAPYASARKKWLDELRDHMGRQDIDVYGIDPRSRVARILVEADYRMKLVGMGLEEGVLGVKSYLDALKRKSGDTPQPMNVLRWWFALNYKSVTTTPDRDAFQFDGQGARVLSENELITELGERHHTGTSDELTNEFAHSFTANFARLADKYPIYAELKNIFDLALVSALVQTERLADRGNWQMLYFGPPRENLPAYEVNLGVAPTEVETVINHVMLGRKNIVAGVSGGVSVKARAVVNANEIKQDTYGLMKAERDAATPRNLSHHTWWWD